MRILRHAVDLGSSSHPDPAAVFLRLFSSAAHAFWLDAGTHAVSGMSFMGSSASVVRAGEGAVTVESGGGGEERHSGGVLDFLEAQPMVPSDGEGAVPLGWVGWLDYGMGLETTGVRMPHYAARTRREGTALMFVDRAIGFDHATGRIELIAIGDSWTGEFASWRTTILRELHASGSGQGLGSGAGEPSAAAIPTDAVAVWRDSDSEYLEKIARCQRFIRDGDAYQLCLTTEVVVDVHLDPVTTYLAQRAASPSHHGGFLRIGETSLLSSSPELFLSVSPAGVIVTKPIKGTRRRGADQAEDEKLIADLISDPKERAENLMIVDLMRNDLARVCELSTVTVASLLAVETYATVHQLVSTVRGRLAADRHPVDVIRACFPAGSMTGAPKLWAMELLDRIEGRSRGVYSGAFGWIGLDGSIELAMAIRSIVIDDRGARIGTGGGITAGSAPAAELAEVKLKAAALLAVLGVRTDATARETPAVGGRGSGVIRRVSAL